MKFHCAIPAMLVMAASLLSVQAFAQDNDAEFSALMTEGVKQYKAGQADPAQYEAAIATFRKAYQLNPNPDILYNIARANHMLNHCEDALASYREYALTSAENASSVENYITELSQKCGIAQGTLALTCVPQDAVLMIDGVAAEYCSGEHKVKAGSHKYSFLANGYVAETREISLEKDQAKSIRIEMAAEKDAPSLTPPSASASTPSSDKPKTQAASQSNGLAGKGTLFWSGVGTTAGGVILMVIGGSVMGTAHREITYNDTKGFYERSSGRLTGGAVTLGIGAAAALAGIGLFIADAILDKPDDSQAFRMVPAVSVTPDGASAMMTVNF